MKYRNLKVKDASSEELLFELLQRNGTQGGPSQTRYYGEWQCCTVGIGDDHTAEIRLPAEDKGVLETMVGERNG